MIFRTWSLHALAAVVLSLFLAGPTLGQGRGGWGGLEASPDYDVADVDEMLLILRLSEDQYAVVDSLLSGYQEAFRTSSEQMQSEMRSMFETAREEGGDRRELFEKVREMRTQWSQTRVSMNESFAADVRALLSPEQDASWSVYERERRRRRELTPRSLFSSEGVDVAAVLAEIDTAAAQRESLAGLIESYKTEVDAALVDRNAALERIDDVDFEPEAMEDPQYLDDVRAVARRRVTLAAVNENYAAEIAAQMDPESREAFTEAIQRATFPGVYRQPEAQGFLDSVTALPDLSDDQAQRLESLTSSYEQSVADVNRQLADLQKQIERDIQAQITADDPTASPWTAAALARWGQRPGGRSPVSSQDVMATDEQFEQRRTLLEQRRTLGRETIEAAWSVLSPDQQAGVQKPEIPLLEEDDDERRIERSRRWIREMMENGPQWQRGNRNRGRGPSQT